MEKLKRLEAVLDRECEVPVHKRLREDHVIITREAEEVALLEAITGMDSVPSLRLLALRSLDAQRQQPSAAFVAYWHNRFAANSLLAQERAARAAPSLDVHSARRTQWFLGMCSLTHQQHAELCGTYGLLADAAREEANAGVGDYCCFRLEKQDPSRGQLGVVSASSELAWRDGTAMSERAMRFDSTLVDVGVFRQATDGEWVPRPVSWEDSLMGARERLVRAR